jgi:MFS family permease
MAYYGMANSLAFAAGPALGGFIIHADFLSTFDGWFTSRAHWLSGAHTGDLHFTTLFLVAALTTLAGAGMALRLGETRPGGAPVRRIDARHLFATSAAFPALINFTTAFVFAAIVSFLPLFARDHGVSNPGNLFLVYALFVILMRFTLGRWMDRAPRIIFIVPGILLLSACMVTLVLANNALMLYGAMVLYGAGAGTFQPAMMAHLVDRTGPSERGRALSTFTLGNDLGLSLGSFVFGFIAESAGYRTGFGVAAVMAAVGALLFASSWLRERHAVIPVLIPQRPG